MKVFIIVVDALRKDVFEECMKKVQEFFKDGYYIKDFYAQCCLTDVSTTTILTGKYPQEHGIVAQGQPGEPKARLISQDFKSSLLVCPAIRHKPYFKHYYSCLYSCDFPLSLIGKYDFNYLHFMDCHDYIYPPEDIAKKLRENGIKIKFPNPGIKNQFWNKEDFWRAYKNTARVMDKYLYLILREIEKLKDYLIVFTADHGEERAGGHGKLTQETIYIPCLVKGTNISKMPDFGEHVDIAKWIKGIFERDNYDAHACEKYYLNQEVLVRGNKKVYKIYRNGEISYVFARVDGIDEKIVEIEDEEMKRVIDEFSNSFENNPVKHGEPYHEMFKKGNADWNFIKTWLKGFELRDQ